MGSMFNVALARFAPERLRGVGCELAGRHRRHAPRRAARISAPCAYRAPTLLLMGSEGPGLSPALEAACTRLVKIPMAGRLDSLNLAVAAALVLYEIRREKLKI